MAGPRTRNTLYVNKTLTVPIMINHQPSVGDADIIITYQEGTIVRAKVPILQMEHCNRILSITGRQNKEPLKRHILSGIRKEW